MVSIISAIWPRFSLDPQIFKQYKELCARLEEVILTHTAHKIINLVIPINLIALNISLDFYQPVLISATNGAGILNKYGFEFALNKDAVCIFTP